MGNSQSDKIQELTTTANIRTAYPSYKTSQSTPERDAQFKQQYCGWHLGYPEIDKYMYIHPDVQKR